MIEIEGVVRTVGPSEHEGWSWAAIDVIHGTLYAWVRSDIRPMAGDHARVRIDGSGYPLVLGWEMS